MFDFKVYDSIFNDGSRIHISRMEDIGDVPVYKDIARLETEDGGFGDPRVGTADPKNRGLLAFGETGKEVRLL